MIDQLQLIIIIVNSKQVNIRDKAYKYTGALINILKL